MTQNSAALGTTTYKHTNGKKKRKRNHACLPVLDTVLRNAVAYQEHPVVEVGTAGGREDTPRVQLEAHLSKRGPDRRSGPDRRRRTTLNTKDTFKNKTRVKTHTKTVFEGVSVTKRAGHVQQNNETSNEYALQRLTLVCSNTGCFLHQPLHDRAPLVRATKVVGVRNPPKN